MSPLEIDEANDPLGPDPDPGPRRASLKGVLNMSLLRYMELLEWMGQINRSDKRGAIPENIQPILERIGYTAEAFVTMSSSYDSRLNKSFITATEAQPADVKNEQLAGAG